MTTLSPEPAPYESIAPSTPFERFLLTRMESLEARVGELEARTTKQAETAISQAEEIEKLENRSVLRPTPTNTTFEIGAGQSLLWFKKHD